MSDFVTKVYLLIYHWQSTKSRTAHKKKTKRAKDRQHEDVCTPNSCELLALWRQHEWCPPIASFSAKNSCYGMCCTSLAGTDTSQSVPDKIWTFNLCTILSFQFNQHAAQFNSAKINPAHQLASLINCPPSFKPAELNSAETAPSDLIPCRINLFL